MGRAGRRAERADVLGRGCFSGISEFGILNIGTRGSSGSDVGSVGGVVFVVVTELGESFCDRGDPLVRDAGADEGRCTRACCLNCVTKTIGSVLMNGEAVTGASGTVISILVSQLLPAKMSPFFDLSRAAWLCVRADLGRVVALALTGRDGLL